MSSDQSESFSSRIVFNLTNEINNCEDGTEKSILLARRAGALARHSYIAEAKETIRKLRLANVDYEARLSGWILFTEGTIEHFNSLDNKTSKDKFLRAFLVGQMGNDRQLAGTSAAWLAHCQLVSGEFKAALQNIELAFKWSDPDFGEARGRASMVIADALSWTGKIPESRAWYRDARSHAVRDGDIAMQNAIIFNLATQGVADLTIRDCQSALTEKEWKFSELEVASAHHLNGGLGIKNLSYMIPLLQAELFVVQRRWTDAAEKLDENLTAVENSGLRRLLPRLLAQRAWCRANIGENDAAAIDSMSAIERIDLCTDPDDLAVTYFRLSSTALKLGNAEVSKTSHTMALEALARYFDQQRELSGYLSPVIHKITAERKSPA